MAFEFAGRPALLDGFDFVEGAGGGGIGAEQRAIVRPREVGVKLTRSPRFATHRVANWRNRNERRKATHCVAFF